ncbi:MAG: 4-hydroxythreonine-4-phosphate dehydrogenase PdxA [Betaproteobacteria bacterium RIFCSPLOWO2_02_FULL_67_26]|nr:MAG: 4-hydroxythreonine-4-phosphate dehydrogenase PdxA [Betaproteobacteria bacterium RIFCSPLOWO2_02_FULL_67_26]
MPPLIAVTAGEPAGIGPDLCIALASRRLPARIVVVADRELIAERARRLRVPLRLAEFPPAPAKPRAGTLWVHHQPLARPAVPGRLDPANSRYVLRTLEAAADGCRDGVYAAMVTAPLHKSVILSAGIAFTGHTEFLAAHTGARHVVMMLVGGGMRVALATTHLALKDVARHITRESLEQTLRVLRHDLATRFALPRPRILVAGLNPHAGESGFLGSEETEIIAPVLAKLRRAGFDLEGPLPADTLFNRRRLAACDCVLAMYHDQGLPVLKYASFGAGVNVTLGLPIIRTSVDHGTALDLAATGRAEVGSLIEAIKLAAALAARGRGRKQRAA